LFLVLFYRALESVRGGRDRIFGIPILVILPVATILWTNLHGGFFFGILLLVCYGAGEVLKLILSADRSQAALARVRARQYLLSALACLAASLVNPYFYHLHVHVVQYVTDPFQAQHVVEFLTISFHHPIAIFFESLLVLGVAAAIWQAGRGRYTEAVLVVMWGHVALLAARNVPLYAIISAPIVAAAADAWLKRLPDLQVVTWLRTAARRVVAIAAETAETDAIPRWHVASLAGFAIVAALVYAPAPPKLFKPEYDPESYPAAAIAMLKADPSARIFTNDEWGDYLIYRLYPQNRVFVDGRSDFYGDDFVQKYLDVMNVKYDWQQTLGNFGINTILLPPSAPLAGALKESSRWRVVYDDGISLVFRPTGNSGAESSAPTPAGGAGERSRTITKTDMRQMAAPGHKLKT
jgi:hypothetical protein